MAFAGVQLVPPQLVPVARQVLAQQGLSQSLIDNNGTIAMADLFALAFNQVEIRTAFSPPMKFRVDGPSDPATQALLKRVQPAMILNGPAGQVAIAPYGIPSGIDPDMLASAGKKTGAGLVLGAIGAFLVIRYAFR